MTATDELAAILARITAEPDEDTHRLAYADRLDERGEPGDAERAEFVRVQVELATLPEPAELTHGSILPRSWEEETIEHCVACRPLKALCRYHVLIERERELRREIDLWSLVPWVQPEWDWTITTHAREPRFRVGKSEWTQNIWHELRRGFAERVECEAFDWLRYADAILADSPVRAVTLTTWPVVEHDPINSRPIPLMWLAGRTKRLDIPKGASAAFMHRHSGELLKLEWPRITFTLPPEPV